MEVLGLFVERVKIYIALPLERWWNRHQFYADNLLETCADINSLQSLIETKEITTEAIPEWLNDEVVDYIVSEVGNKAADILLNDWYDLELVKIKCICHCIEDDDFVPTRQIIAMYKAAIEIINGFLSNITRDIDKTSITPS